MNDQDEQRQLAAARADLVREFSALSAEEVDACFGRTVAGFTTAPIRTFIPVLASRLTRQELRRTSAV